MSVLKKGEKIKGFFKDSFKALNCRKVLIERVLALVRIDFVTGLKLLISRY